MKKHLILILALALSLAGLGAPARRQSSRAAAN